MPVHFRHKSRVLITGGSRGLGLSLARQYAKQGAHVILCARNIQELERAKMLLSSISDEVTIYKCDLTDDVQIDDMVKKIRGKFGGIDFLVNNAGIIDVGPLDTLQTSDFERVVNTNLFGMIRITLAIVPLMKRGSHIVNITSIGATVAVPHLITYSVSKFGALGFSLGLDAELATHGIKVTTVLPGLMRTGSYLQASFRGNIQKEFNWFSFISSLPFLSLSADRAARKIVQASRKGNRFVVLSPQARFLRIFYQIFPTAALMLMRGVIRLMPRVSASSHENLKNVESVQGMNLRHSSSKEPSEKWLNQRAS